MAAKEQILKQIKELSSKNEVFYAGLQQELDAEMPIGKVSSTAFNILNEVLAGAELDNLTGLRDRLSRLQEVKKTVRLIDGNGEESKFVLESANKIETALKKHIDHKTKFLTRAKDGITKHLPSIADTLEGAFADNPFILMAVKAGRKVNELRKNKKAKTAQKKADLESFYANEAKKKNNTSSMDVTQGAELKNTRLMPQKSDAGGLVPVIGNQNSASPSVVAKSIITMSSDIKKLVRMYEQNLEKTDIAADSSAFDSLESQMEDKNALVMEKGVGYNVLSGNKVNRSGIAGAMSTQSSGGGLIPALGGAMGGASLAGVFTAAAPYVATAAVGLGGGMLIGKFLNDYIVEPTREVVTNKLTDVGASIAAEIGERKNGIDYYKKLFQQKDLNGEEQEKAEKWAVEYLQKDVERKRELLKTTYTEQGAADAEAAEKKLKDYQEYLKVRDERGKGRQANAIFVDHKTGKTMVNPLYSNEENQKMFEGRGGKRKLFGDSSTGAPSAEATLVRAPIAAPVPGVGAPAAAAGLKQDTSTFVAAPVPGPTSAVAAAMGGKDGLALKDIPAANKMPPAAPVPGPSADKDQMKALAIKELAAKGITDPTHQANIMANLEAESNFSPQSENLEKYSAKTLMKLYGPGSGNKVRFNSIEEAQAVVDKGPEAVGNVIYGGRMGNAADEGYKFRGRGLVQLTGKTNYEQMGKKLGVDLVNNPDLANDPAIAAKIQAQYYSDRKNKFDFGKIENVAKATGHAGGEKENLRRAKLSEKYQAQIQSGAFNPETVLAEERTSANPVQLAMDNSQKQSNQNYNTVAKQSAPKPAPAPQAPITVVNNNSSGGAGGGKTGSNEAPPIGSNGTSSRGASYLKGWFA